MRQLAERFGIPVPELETSDGARDDAAARQSLLKVHEVAAAYSAQLEAQAGRIRDYLQKERDLTEDTIARLQLGYAPGRDALRQHLLKAGFAPAVMMTSGLVTRRDDGNEVTGSATG